MEGYRFGGLMRWTSPALITICFVILLPNVIHSTSKYSMPDNLDLNAMNLDDASIGNPYDDLRTFGNSGSQFIKKRLYNTSIALTASFFSYFLPQTTKPGTVTDLVNQAIYGLFGTLAVCLIYGVPVLLTGIMYQESTGRSNDDGETNNWITSPIMKIENVKRIFDEQFRDQIGLDSTKCLLKTVCEAHRSPKNKKYGLLALPFQMFFPPREKGTSEARANSYQIAAAYGKYTKEGCAKRYKCFFDTLDLAVFLIDWYRLSHDPEYVPDEADFY